MLLNELLDAAEYIGIKVANKQANLLRSVTTVGMMEAPDISDFIVPEQLLVTTGYHFYQNVDALLQLILEMDNKGCAAIGIKEKRYFDEIPDEVLELADSLNFPVLLLPSNKSLSVVVKELLHDVLESHSNELIKIIDYNNLFSKLLLEEERFVPFLDKVSEVLLKDVFILDSHIEITYTSHNLYYKRAILTKILQEKENHLLLTTSTDEKVNVTFQGQPLLLLPFYTTNKMTRGYFGILGLAEMDYEMTILGQQIVNLIGIANARLEIEKEMKYQSLTDFFNAIIEGQIDKDTIVSQLTQQQIEVSTEYYCGTIKIISTKQGYFISKNTERQVADFVRWYAEDQKKEVLVFQQDHRINLLIPKQHDRYVELKKLYNFLSLKFEHHYTFLIGYSHQSALLPQLTTIYKEATEALLLISPATQHSIVEYRPKEFNELLLLLPKSESNDFVEKVLSPLLEIESKEKRKHLLDTLYLYFFHARSLQRVADDLYTHRNTILYRIKDIQKLLSVNFEDPSQRLNVMLASILYHNQYQ